MTKRGSRRHSQRNGTSRRSRRSRRRHGNEEARDESPHARTGRFAKLAAERALALAHVEYGTLKVTDAYSDRRFDAIRRGGRKVVASVIVTYDKTMILREGAQLVSVNFGYGTLEGEELSARGRSRINGS